MEGEREGEEGAGRWSAVRLVPISCLIIVFILVAGFFLLISYICMYISPKMVMQNKPIHLIIKLDEHTYSSTNTQTNAC